MNIQFINRTEELKFLNKKYSDNSRHLIPIYGRRRVGKTELIKNFCKEKPHIYFLADKGREKDQLREFSLLIGEFFKDETLINGLFFENWPDLFKYLAKKCKNKKLVLVIDEFPYLIESNKAIVSLFQKAWDEYLKKTKIFLILCASNFSMMEKEVLAYKSPLYGRRTGQMKISKLKFKEVKLFFQKRKIEDIIKLYSICDGIPAYLLKMRYQSFYTNLLNNFLDQNEALYLESEILLKEEFREPNMYFSILKAISFGKNKPNEIANYIGEERTTLTRYLDSLEKLHFIEKELPVTEKNPHKSRKGIYKITDNYLLFWFRWIYPFKSWIENGKSNIVLEKIKKGINLYISFIFEEICKQKISLSNRYEKVGKYWFKDNEIDICAINKDKKEILFGECKWKEKIDPQKILDQLKSKAKKVLWNNENRIEKYAIFAKSFKTKNIKDVELYDLKDL